MSGSDPERVQDILDGIEAIDRAQSAVQRYPRDHDVARVALGAARHAVFTIREAILALSLDIREDHPAVPWSDMAAMGDLIGPECDQLDPQTVRATIGEPVKKLRSACRAILAESVRVGEDEP